MSFDELQKFWRLAVDRLDANGGNMCKLPEPLQTLVIVQAAQGVIDNGGLEYFYESDFPDNPPYDVFVSAYRRIGATEAAAIIKATAQMFPFPEPHLHESERQTWMEANSFSTLSDKICGDESVYLKLADYVEVHKHLFVSV